MFTSGEVQVYEIDAIQDDGIRIQYQTLRKRFLSLADQIQSTYDLDGKSIDVTFVVDGTFNASVEMSKDRYLIQISNAVPVLLMILFDKLLSDGSNLPWVSSEGTGEVSYDIPFSVKANDLSERQNWLVETNKIRAFASYTLADIATSFVFLHELGHILGGHLKDLEARNEKAFHAEFNMRETSGKEVAWLHQLREYQADSVGAYLVTHIIEELIEDVSVNERTRAVFGPGEIATENTISLTVSALYGLFAYVKGQERRLKRHASHPDPLVRAIYTRDFIYQIMQSQSSFDVELSQDMLQARFDEMNVVLQSLDLIDQATVTDKGIDDATAVSDRLKELQYTRGKEAARFAFIEWE
ncbi:MAG: hypothetical protein AAGA38_18160 [Pseudomonadota bacterium]